MAASCRMVNDLTTSVVIVDFCSHDLQNLFIVGSTVFPTSGKVSKCAPTGSCSALGTAWNRVGMCLARRFLLPLLPPREEGWGEEGRLACRCDGTSAVKCPSPRPSPFVPHGERECGSRAKHIHCNKFAHIPFVRQSENS